MQQLWPVFILLTLSVLTLAACGGGGGNTKTVVTIIKEATPTPTPTATPDVGLTQQQVLSVKLKAPRAKVLRQIGQPTGSGPQDVKGEDCTFYKAFGEEPMRLQYRFCYRKNRLHIVASYIQSNG